MAHEINTVLLSVGPIAIAAGLLLFARWFDARRAASVAKRQQKPKNQPFDNDDGGPVKPPIPDPRRSNLNKVSDRLVISTEGWVVSMYPIRGDVGFVYKESDARQLEFFGVIGARDKAG